MFLFPTDQEVFFIVSKYNCTTIVNSVFSYWSITFIEFTEFRKFRESEKLLRYKFSSV